MSTLLKCDHCKATKDETIVRRNVRVFAEALSIEPDSTYGKRIATFSADLCDACQSGLIDIMQKFLRVKPTMPEAGE